MDLAGAGRSGIVNDKVAKSTSRDQQVWQIAVFRRITLLFLVNLKERVAGTLLFESEN